MRVTVDDVLALLEPVSRLADVTCNIPVRIKDNKLSFLTDSAMYEYDFTKENFKFPDVDLDFARVHKIVNGFRNLSTDPLEVSATNTYLSFANHEYDVSVHTFPTTYADAVYRDTSEVVLRPAFTHKYKAEISAYDLRKSLEVIKNFSISLYTSISFGNGTYTINNGGPSSASATKLVQASTFPAWYGVFREESVNSLFSQLENQNSLITLSASDSTKDKPSALMVKVPDIRLTAVLTPVVMEPIV